MKEKIFSALKAKIVDKAGKTSISDKTLNAYTDLIAGQITDESQIETAIAPSVVVLKEIQANINKVAADAVNAKETELKTAEEKKKADEEAARKAAEESAKGKNPDVPEWQKAIEGLTATVQTLANTVSGINAEKTQTTLSQKLAEKIKDIPEWYRTPIVNGRSFKDEAEVNAFAEDLTGKWETARQQLANQGFQEAKPPEQGAGAPANDSSTIVSQINAGTKQIVESQKTEIKK